MSSSTFFVIRNSKGQFLAKQERTNWYMGVGSRAEREIVWTPDLQHAQLWSDVRQTKKIQNMQSRGEFRNAPDPLTVVVCRVTREIVT